MISLLLLTLGTILCFVVIIRSILIKRLDAWYFILVVIGEGMIAIADILTSKFILALLTILFMIFMTLIGISYLNEN